MNSIGDASLRHRARPVPPGRTNRAGTGGRRRSGQSGGPAGRVLGAATVAMGLIAGVFYAYVISVMPALGKVDDRTFVMVMQRINKVILNPFFYAVFLGSFALTAAAAVLQRRLGLRDATRWIGGALALYGMGFLVTIGVNVPLNDRLAAAGPVDRIVDVAAVRRDFEARWVAGNTVRAVACTLALACLARALVLHGRTDQSTAADPAGRDAVHR